VLVARFFALLRQLNGIAAGTVGMSWWRFLAYNAVGAALWVSAWGFGVYYFGETLGHVITRIHGLGYLIGLLALILIVGCIAFYGWRRGRTPG
jgi:membrane protein DedA with SNARE-associated domain